METQVETRYEGLELQRLEARNGKDKDISVYKPRAGAHHGFHLLQVGSFNFRESPIHCPASSRQRPRVLQYAKAERNSQISKIPGKAGLKL